ncbi:hypothetical protein CF15_07955 [Pyrodictium occultum]|uniref:UbiD family decarboxylase n=1 Tax=Pyrodictium occultum TaxID=2309 RepID=A0A0V8RRZ8_PYROC|nr:hypothetical protein CF15_07955 [Pyrodictium occultum]
MAGELLPRLRLQRDETRRFLLLLAWLNTRLEEEGLGRIIVTGGFAAEVYTGRVYRTMDVDVIVEGRAALLVLEALLRRVAEPLARGYLPRDEALAVKSVDIVSTVYSRPAPPVKLVVDGYHVYIEPPEEILVRYLAGWKHWGSTEDRDKALWIYTVWRDRLDWGYLVRRAREEGVEDKLRELAGLVERARSRREA